MPAFLGNLYPFIVGSKRGMTAKINVSGGSSQEAVYTQNEAVSGSLASVTLQESWRSKQPPFCSPVNF